MRIVLASLAFVAFAGPVAAQERGQAVETTPQALTQVYACRDIADEAQRLACYDGAVGRLREAESSGSVVAIDRGQAQEMDREAFGFSLPSLSRIFRGGERQTASSTPRFEPVDEIAMEIASVTHQRNGPSTFRMTNGQTWVQIDDEVARNVRQGGSVTVRRASLSSFLMSVAAGGPAIRVRRIQ